MTLPMSDYKPLNILGYSVGGGKKQTIRNQNLLKLVLCHLGNVAQSGVKVVTLS